MNRIKIRRLKTSIILALLSTGITILLFLWVTQAQTFSWKIPFIYTGDGLIQLMLTKGLVKGEWSPIFETIQSRLLGAPFGMNLGDFPVTERLNFILVKILSFGSGNTFLAFNLFYVLTFILISWSAMSVLRRLKVHSGIALVFGILFSILPFHFFRLAHLGLTAYFLIPYQILVALWVWSKKPLFFKKVEGSFYVSFQDKKSKIALVTLCLSGVLAFYYAFFFCIFCGLSGLGAYFYRRSKVHLLSSILCCILVCGSFFISFLPYKIYTVSRGPNPEVAHRAPVEAELFALKLTNILLPVPNHRLDAFKNLRARYQSATPPYEGTNEPIGTLGLIGFLLCLFQVYLLRTGFLMRKLAAFQVTAVLFGTLGGFGALFSLFGGSVIRSYNRISVFIAFISLAVLALCLESLRKWILKNTESWGLNQKFVRAALGGGLILVFCFGALDQTNSDMRLQAPIKEFESDHEFVKRIEGKNPPGAMILQLPYFPFPENGPMLRMEDYSHFRGYLHSDSLRWSYGTMRGREEDEVIRELASFPPDLAKIKKEGFSGIYIDRYGYPDDAAILEKRLSEELKQKPLVSLDGRLSYFSL